MAQQSFLAHLHTCFMSGQITWPGRIISGGPQEATQAEMPFPPASGAVPRHTLGPLGRKLPCQHKMSSVDPRSKHAGNGILFHGVAQPVASRRSGEQGMESVSFLLCVCTQHCPLCVPPAMPDLGGGGGGGGICCYHLHCFCHVTRQSLPLSFPELQNGLRRSPAWLTVKENQKQTSGFLEIERTENIIFSNHC